ncbi:class I SAM-dependent RNA methyltransferase [Candidatus Saccharibacteria bacterium]|nr:class I SAM-dependent RNA methyltransferase [Candidatus Saccharibacteria bacterium]
MIKVEKIIPGGQSLATADDGKKIFFWNALPGEEVTDFLVTKNKSHYTEAIATEVSLHSPYRISPYDECFLSTSPWQIMDYDYELSEKQSLVVEMFREHGIELPRPSIFTDGNPYFYRNKMEYSLYWDNDENRISLAFHARGSHRKIPVKKSSIERPEIFDTACRIVDDLNRRGEQARKYQSLLLRCNQDGEVSGGLYENGKPHPTFLQLTDTILGHTYSYSPNGFFQINLPVYEMALEEMKKHINTSKVLDLYSGVGTIGLSIARDHELTLVEVDKYAFDEATKNIATLNVGNILGILSRSEDVLDHIESNQTVILDPPRAGCDSKLIDKLLAVTPPTIIYLSCNPATQARDVKMLLDKYHISTAMTYNFFPRTPHIENLIVLSL